MLPAVSGPTMIALTVFYRSRGFQVPLKSDDVVFVSHARTHELIFVTSGEYIITLLRHEMDKLALQALTAMEMERKDERTLNVERGPHTDKLPFSRERKEQMRAQRRRKPLSKSPKRTLLFPLGAACAIANAHRLPDINDLFWTLYAVVEAWL
jgi:hypothetical protein